MTDDSQLPADELCKLRLRIDAVDRSIITLIAARSRLVEAIVWFKHSPQVIRVPSRERFVMANARQTARATGLDIIVIERIYETLLEAFVDYEGRCIDRAKTDDALSSRTHRCLNDRD